MQVLRGPPPNVSEKLVGLGCRGSGIRGCWGWGRCSLGTELEDGWMDLTTGTVRLYCCLKHGCGVS